MTSMLPSVPRGIPSFSKVSTMRRRSSRKNRVFGVGAEPHVDRIEDGSAVNLVNAGDAGRRRGKRSWKASSSWRVSGKLLEGGEHVVGVGGGVDRDGQGGEGKVARQVGDGGDL